MSFSSNIPIVSPWAPEELNIQPVRRLCSLWLLCWHLFRGTLSADDQLGLVLLYRLFHVRNPGPQSSFVSVPGQDVAPCFVPPYHFQEQADFIPPPLV